MPENSSVSNGFSKITGIAIAIAILSLFAAVYFYTQQNQTNDELTRANTHRDQIQQEFDEQRVAAGTVADLNEQIAVLTPQLQELTAKREGEQDSANTLLAQVEDLRANEHDLRSQIEAAQVNVDTLTQELIPLREELATYEQRRGELEQSVSDQNAELTQIGERVEQARNQEAQIQEALSQLTDETVRLTEDAANSEAALQNGRAELSEITATLEQSRSERDTLQQQLAKMQSDADAAEDRSAGLKADVAATETQRNELQQTLVTLTDTIALRAQKLADLENRIAGTITSEPSGTTQNAAPKDGAQEDEGSTGAPALTKEKQPDEKSGQSATEDAANGDKQSEGTQSEQNDSGNAATSQDARPAAPTGSDPAE